MTKQLKPMRDYPQDYWVLLDRVEEKGEHSMDIGETSGCDVLRLRLYRFLKDLGRHKEHAKSHLAERVRIKRRGNILTVILGDRTMEEMRMSSSLGTKRDLTMEDLLRLSADMEKQKGIV